MNLSKLSMENRINIIFDFCIEWFMNFFADPELYWTHESYPSKNHNQYFTPQGLKIVRIKYVSIIRFAKGLKYLIQKFIMLSLKNITAILEKTTSKRWSLEVLMVIKKFYREVFRNTIPLKYIAYKRLQKFSQTIRWGINIKTFKLSVIGIKTKSPAFG